MRAGSAPRRLTLRSANPHPSLNPPGSRSKTPLDEVLVAPWRPQLPDWAWWQAHPEAVARSRRFAGGSILADRWRPGGRLSSRLLHELARRCSAACGLCDPRATRPFPSPPDLARHVREAHDHRM